MTTNQQPQRHPGAWPVSHPADLGNPDETDHDALYVRRAQERALHEMVLDSIRHDLNQQPSPAAIRTAAARWKTAIAYLADELINTRRNDR